MSVEQKIDAFIQGITCSTTQNIIVSLAGDATIRDTFEDYNNAVACRLELALSFANKPAYHYRLENWRPSHLCPRG